MKWSKFFKLVPAGAWPINTANLSKAKVLGLASVFLLKKDLQTNPAFEQKATKALLVLLVWARNILTLVCSFNYSTTLVFNNLFKSLAENPSKNAEGANPIKCPKLDSTASI